MPASMTLPQQPHWPAARAILETARVRAIKTHASGVETPPGLDDPAKVLIGVYHYAAHCAVCHGAPGVPKGDVGRGLYPPPQIWRKRRHSTLAPNSSGSSSTVSK